MKLYKYIAITFGFLFTSLIAAQVNDKDKFTTQLWSTEQPSCILIYNPNNEKIKLPEPYTPPSVKELFGEDMTEEKLINQKTRIQKFETQKIQVGNNVTFTVTYADGANEGFNDQTLGAARKAAFEFGMRVWANNLQGPASISVQATMTPRGGTANAATLASAAPAQYFRNYTNAPFTSTWYPECLVEIISGTDPDNNMLDINVDFNSDVDNNTVLGNRDFYYGTDASPGNDFDFVTITIHEICHGLGFLDSFTATGDFGFGDPKDPNVYDRFLVDSTGALLINKTVSGNNVTGNNVFWVAIGGKYVYNRIFNRTNSIPMFAPTPYQGGSSIGHLDEGTFTGIYELETPNSSSAVHVPDVIALGILQDIGYSLPNSRYVDQNATGFEDGSNANPFNALWKGFVSVPQNGILRLWPNEYQVSSGNNGPVVINQKMTLSSYGGVSNIILIGGGLINEGLPASSTKENPIMKEISRTQEELKKQEIYFRRRDNETK